MKPKIQCFFMLLAAVLFCLSGCGQKEEEMTFGPQGTAQTDTGSGANVRVEAGQNCFYYESSDGILYAVPAGTRVKERLGAGKLLGADEQYAYLWQESKLRVLDGARQAAEFDCLLRPSYWSTKNGCAYFSVENEDASCSLLILQLSSLMMEQHQVGVQIMSAAVEKNQFYYVRFNTENKQILCRYDLESAEEQVLLELGFNSWIPKVQYVNRCLYFKTDTMFYCYHLDDGTEEILLQAEGMSAQYDGRFAYILFNHEKERFLWRYDMEEKRLISNEKSVFSIYTNAFGLTFYQDGAGWFGEEEAQAVFDERFAATLHGLSGSPAGIIAHSWPGEIMIAFKQPDGSYDVQFTEQLFDR